MKKLGIALLFGVIVVCMGMKFNSVAMNQSNSSPLDMVSTSTGTHVATAELEQRKRLINQLEKINAQIAKKEQELEKSSRFEEFSVAKELNALKRKQAKIHHKILLNEQLPIREALQTQCSRLRKKFVEFLYLKTAKMLPHESIVAALAWSPDGRKLITGSGDGMAKIWNTITAEQIGPDLQHADYVSSVAWSPDGSKVSTGSRDRRAKIWDATTAAQIGPDLQHNNAVSVVAWSPDGNKLLTGSWDNTARIWNVVTGMQIGQDLQHDGTVYAATWSPDGNKVITGSEDDTAKIWNAVTGAQIGLDLEHNGAVYSVAWSLDGSTLATGSNDGIAKIWNATTGVQRGSNLDPHWFNYLLNKKVSILSVAFSPDSKKLATAGHAGIKIWDVDTGAQIKQNVQAMQHEIDVNEVVWSPDGKNIATGSTTGAVKVWDVITGAQVGPNLQYHSLVVAFSPDGKKLATGSDVTARIWDLQTIPQFLSKLTIDQCDLLQAFDMMVRREELGKPLMPIQATNSQWYTFTTFPKVVQDALRLYIKNPKDKK